MNLYDIWFSTVKLHDEIKNNLMNSFNNTEELWFFLRESKDYNYSFSVKPLLDSMKLGYIEKLMDVTIREGIKIITKKDENYPSLLKNYDDSPYVLYYLGDIQKINKLINISIVTSDNDP